MNKQSEAITNFIIQKDLEFLLNAQILGEYNCVEITEVFALINKGSQPINLFTIMVAENRVIENVILNEWTLINSRPIKISGLKFWDIGIKTYLVSIDKAIDMFVSAENNNEWDSCGCKIQTPGYIYQKRIFTPPDSFQSIPLNSILKNNFHNGSYVVELINQFKVDLSVFFEKTVFLQELAKKLLKYLPIDISSLSDRLGNIIFQIPVRSIQVRTNLLPDNKSIECKIAWHPNIQPRDVVVCGYQEDSDFNKIEFYVDYCLKASSLMNIPFEHEQPYSLVICDMDSKLILHSLPPSSFIRSMGLSTVLTSYESRVVYHDGIDVAIPLIGKVGTHIIGENNTENTDWSNIRIYENNREKLKSNLEFVQYNPKGKNKKTEHENALIDLRVLINKYGEKGAYLWDPYLSPKDIVKTLYYSKFSNSTLKAISSLKVPQSGKNSYIFDQYKNEFEAHPQEMMIGINLEFRSPRKNYGWNFHDRFLIFPDFKNLPMAWSLGTSVNSLGQEHHILQKCSDARLILDAFNELWDEIDNDECLIWGSK